MMGITVKTSHGYIGKTAEIYGSGSYNILSKILYMYRYKIII